MQIKAAEAVAFEIVQAMFRHTEGHVAALGQSPAPVPALSPSEGHTGPPARYYRANASRTLARSFQPSAAYIANLNQSEIQSVAERARRAAADAAEVL